MSHNPGEPSNVSLPGVSWIALLKPSLGSRSMVGTDFSANLPVSAASVVRGFWMYSIQMNGLTQYSIVYIYIYV